MPAFSGLPLSSQVQLPVFLLGDTPYSILQNRISQVKVKVLSYV